MLSDLAPNNARATGWKRGKLRLHLNTHTHKTHTQCHTAIQKPHANTAHKLMCNVKSSGGWETRFRCGTTWEAPVLCRPKKFDKQIWHQVRGANQLWSYRCTPLSNKNSTNEYIYIYIIYIYNQGPPFGSCLASRIAVSRFVPYVKLARDL